MVEMGSYATATQSSTETDAPHRRRRATTAQAEQAGAGRQAILARTFELDVIPRLLLQSFPPAAPVLVTAAEVVELAGITFRGQDASTRGFVAGLRDKGVVAEALYLDLLAPVARQLGEWWEDDLCNFADVTIGLCRLQNAMRELSPTFLAAANVRPLQRRTAPRVLLVPLPGEQHTFGLSMVHEFFRRGGWDAWSGPVGSRGELDALVRHQWVDVVGFSLACDERLEVARAEIHAVRLASRNPGLTVMVGGPPFAAHPGLAAEIGADGTAENGKQAVAAAGELLRLAGERR